MATASQLLRDWAQELQNCIQFKPNWLSRMDPSVVIARQGL